tara:strand:- start:291 stop:404 length:114 start_codon:yes stop_codon:yes gene_type:complete
MGEKNLNLQIPIKPCHGHEKAEEKTGARVFGGGIVPK